MKLALSILFIISQVSLWVFIIANIFKILKIAPLFTKFTLIISSMVVCIASIPEIILNILLGQSYAYNVVKLIAVAILLVLNIIIVYKETKINPSSKRN